MAQAVFGGENVGLGQIVAGGTTWPSFSAASRVARVRLEVLVLSISKIPRVAADNACTVRCVSLLP